MPNRVLILCTGNSCRSQMAEGFFNELSEGTWLASSAGSHPAGYVHPLAIRVMQELGIDLSTNTSKHLDQFLDERIDLVVTVCSQAEEACPVFPNAAERKHWPFEDPAHATGTEEEQLTEFRAIRDQIQQQIKSFLQSQES